LAKKIKILDLVPVMYSDALKKGFEDRRGLSARLSEETKGLIELDVIPLEKGTASIEGLFDEYVNAPYILQKVKWAEEEGYNAVVIDCFGDPALEPAREIVRIPVVGANHSACFLASQIGDRFSVINILPETEPQIRRLIEKYGLSGHLASIETIDVPVLELEERMDEVVGKVVNSSIKAYREHGAYSIVLGCTGMSSLAEEAQRKLNEEGYDLPIIEPLRAAIYNAIYWVLMGVSHSKEAYKPPRPKKRKTDFELPVK